jgi:hypothetical protein
MVMATCKNTPMNRRDLEGELMASFKRAGHGTREGDEVEAFANAWRTLACLYGRVLDHVDASQRTELVAKPLERVREQVRELYRLQG